MTQKMIRKRDGRLVEFHTEKIRNAIWRSFLGVGQTGMEDVSDALARKVETMLELEGCEPEVEHVQDLVEQVLMQEGYGRTAKAYILYREERSRARQVNSRLMRKFGHQARERQHRRRHRHGYHAALRLRGRQAVLRVLPDEAGVCHGA